MRKHIYCLLAAVSCLSTTTFAEIVVKDDSGQEIRLQQPAQRIITLAPHATETLYAAGAGDKLVGTVEYSDFPPEAKKVRRIGAYSRFDLETITTLKPDLIIAWQTGNPTAQVDKLKALGFNVFVTQPDRIEDIAGQLERYGRLAGTESTAYAAAATFRKRLEGLRQNNANKAKVRVFYQIWKAPLTTVGGPQIISDAIRLCGGENIFGELRQMAPNVSLEAVLEANPEVIIATGMGDAKPEWLDDWLKWKSLAAVQRKNLFHINPDVMQRHTPRILDGTTNLCQYLELARQRRSAQ